MRRNVTIKNTLKLVTGRKKDGKIMSLKFGGVSLFPESELITP